MCIEGHKKERYANPDENVYDEVQRIAEVAEQALGEWKRPLRK